MEIINTTASFVNNNCSPENNLINEANNINNNINEKAHNEINLKDQVPSINHKEIKNINKIEKVQKIEINLEKQIAITNQKEKKTNAFHIKRNIRYFLYIIEMLCQFNLDQGSISVSIKEFKSFFKMTDRELGSFGGISFLGTTIGGIISLSIINKINRRYLILFFLFSNICSLYFPTIISSKILLILCRMITGFAQSFISIYISVWIDQFGISNKKSIMMSLIPIPSAAGYLFGYICAVYTNWRITFRINALLSISYFICIFFSKNLYFSKNIFPKKFINLENINDSLNKENFDAISLFEDSSFNNNEFGNTSILKHAKICFKSKLFCLSTLSLITLLLILSGIQFWINDFLENAIHIPDKKERLFYFIIIILTTMIGSPIISGIIMQKLGGYESNKSTYLPFFCCIFSLIFSNSLFIFQYKIIIAFLFGGYLFSGCIMISSLNGIIMSTIPKIYTGSASSISNLLYNICGRLVGPYFYGVARSIFGADSKIPMIILLDLKFITLLCLYSFLKYKRKNKNN